jgi:hypothetical protein
MTTETIRQQIHEAVETLPVESLSELVQFIDFLQFKTAHRAPETLEVVQLGGLWKDVPFDLTDEDIREVRREFTRRIAQRSRRVS